MMVSALALATACIWSTPREADAASFTLTGIEVPTAGSPDGSVQVGYEYLGLFCHHLLPECIDTFGARRWQAGVLSALPGSGNGFFTFALGLSPDGDTTYGAAEGLVDYIAGVRWVDGSLQHLAETGDPDFGFFAAHDASADGNVIVGQSQWRAGVGTRPARWVGALAPEDLGDLGGADLVEPAAAAYATSADGSVIVGRASAVAGPEAFRWESGVLAGLGDAPGGDHASAAFAVSDDGSVIVGYVTDASGKRAARWVNGVLSMLPTVTVEALSVSASGEYIVGQADLGAFIWSESDGLSYIEDRLVASGLAGLPTSIDSAMSVSNDGLVIGGASSDGGYVATLDANALVPVLAPLAGVALMTGLCMTGSRRLRQPPSASSRSASSSVHRSYTDSSS